MFQFYYYPILILQGLCLLHAYRRRAAQKWFYIIIFIPIVGCLIYIYENFYNRTTIQSISENIKVAVISNYRIDQLEKQLRFSDNMRNRMALADACMKNGRYADAVRLYNESLQGFMADDQAVKTRLLHACFLNKEYGRCVEIGRSIESEKDFKNAEERIAYAWALQYSGYTEEAEKNFIGMDRSFANYQHRYQYCLFLSAIGKTTEAKEKVAGLKDEIQHMKGNERRIHSDVISDIRSLA